MLVNVLTRYAPRITTALAGSAVENQNAFGAPVAGISRRYLAAAAVMNGTAFGIPRIATVVPGVLAPTHLVNTSRFGVETRIRFAIKTLSPPATTNATAFGAPRVLFAPKLLAHSRFAHANVFGAPAAAIVRPLALDGHVITNYTSQQTLALSLTTAKTADVIVLYVNIRSTLGSFIGVSSISDSAGLTWSRRFQHQVQQSDKHSMELWWAHAPAALSADTITIQLSGSASRATAGAFAVNGANVSAPFDTNASLPAFTDYTSGVNTTTHNVSGISTSASRGLLIAGLFDNTGNAGAQAADSGWTKVDGGSNFAIGTLVEYEAVLAPQSNLTQNVFGSANDSHWTAFVDAIRP